MIVSELVVGKVSINYEKLSRLAVLLAKMVDVKPTDASRIIFDDSEIFAALRV